MVIRNLLIHRYNQILISSYIDGEMGRVSLWGCKSQLIKLSMLVFFTSVKKQFSRKYLQHLHLTFCLCTIINKLVRWDMKWILIFLVLTSYVWNWVVGWPLPSHARDTYCTSQGKLHGKPSHSPSLFLFFNDLLVCFHSSPHSPSHPS